ncbi:hypothetical protein CJ030_MR5G025024 [Morella rubra]|uniref:Uncharacterized protein n=1 Tax=Morella rubra TaxID=262757 RepID=A0A6A1VK98_9ROSI|nr:hypothetical protein CJ030_MR5G025024 [Morella rubra]
MDRSKKSITNAGAQTKRPAWAEELIVEMKESIWTMVMLTHMLCKDFNTRLADLETKFALSDRAVTEELNAIRMELFAIQTLIKWVNITGEQLEHVCDAVEQNLDKPVRCRDSD